MNRPYTLEASKPYDQGILKCMVDIIRVSSFVRMIRKHNRAADYSDYGAWSLGDNRVHIEPMLEVGSVLRFSKKRVLFKKMNNTIAREVLKMAKDYEYVELVSNPDHPHMKFIIVTTPGKELLARPFGLLQTLLSKFGLAISLVTSALFISLAVIATSAMKHLIVLVWHLLSLGR